MLLQDSYMKRVFCFFFVVIKAIHQLLAVFLTSKTMAGLYLSVPLKLEEAIGLALVNELGAEMAHATFFWKL